MRVFAACRDPGPAPCLSGVWRDGLTWGAQALQAQPLTELVSNGGAEGGQAAPPSSVPPMSPLHTCWGALAQRLMEGAHHIDTVRWVPGWEAGAHASECVHLAFTAGADQCLKCGFPPPPT